MRLHDLTETNWKVEAALPKFTDAVERHLGRRAEKAYRKSGEPWDSRINELEQRYVDSLRIDNWPDWYRYSYAPTSDSSDRRALFFVSKKRTGTYNVGDVFYADSDSRPYIGQPVANVFDPDSFHIVMTEDADQSDLEWFSDNIEQITQNNDRYRDVLYTGNDLQLVVMSIEPGSEIGSEVHGAGDQFIRVESGQGEFVIAGKTLTAGDGDSVLIPAGVEHNVRNTGDELLKLYALYAPPEHAADTQQASKPQVEEAWSQKYKDSIDCDNPKGFSQRAHCAGKNKRSDESTQAKLHFLKPGELSGSWRDHELRTLGFRQASNGAWFVNQRRWEYLMKVGERGWHSLLRSHPQ